MLILFIEKLIILKYKNEKKLNNSQKNDLYECVAALPVDSNLFQQLFTQVKKQEHI